MRDEGGEGVDKKPPNVNAANGEGRANSALFPVTKFINVTQH